MNCNWQDLEELRLAGRKPALPVIVTTREWTGRNLNSTGMMTIVHKPGDPMPVKLLEGLFVLLMLDTCAQAGRVWRLMRERECLPARCEAWCECDQALTTCCGSCAAMAEIDRALEESDAHRIQ